MRLIGTLVIGTLAGGFAASILLVATGCDFNVDDPYFQGEPTTLAEAPPPIHGGTLLTTRDGRFAVVADPDRHRVVVVDLESHVVREVALERDLELGRLVEDGRGVVYVNARRGGVVIGVDPTSASVVETLEVCAAPRGLTWEPAGDRLHVACADGALISLGPDREVARRLQLSPDLRDVVVTERGLLATRYRAAVALVVDAEGEVTEAPGMPSASLTSPISPELTQEYVPNTAVRTVPIRDVGSATGAVMLHQRARTGVESVFREAPRPRSSYSYSSRPVSTTTDEGRLITWQDPCGNAVAHSALTLLDSNGAPRHVGLPIPRGVTPVDVAVSEGGRIAVGFAGDPGGRFSAGPQVISSVIDEAARSSDGRSCLEGRSQQGLPGQVISVAFHGERLLVQTRSPSGLVLENGDFIELGGASVVDTGHDLFHLDTGGTISCATCHPGAGDDGHVWTFSATGDVRTQPLEGMVGLAPYHRAGDVPSFSQLMDDLQRQMDGPVLEEPMNQAAERWLAALPPPPAGPRVDHEAFERGREVFEAASCTSCHAGELGTDRQLHLIGTSRRLLTAPLAGLALRAPYLHDGRAETIDEAIAWHGLDVEISDAERADLLTYLAGR